MSADSPRGCDRASGDLRISTLRRYQSFGPRPELNSDTRVRARATKPSYRPARPAAAPKRRRGRAAAPSQHRDDGAVAGMHRLRIAGGAMSGRAAVAVIAVAPGFEDVEGSIQSGRQSVVTLRGEWPPPPLLLALMSAPLAGASAAGSHRRHGAVDRHRCDYAFATESALPVAPSGPPARERRRERDRSRRRRWAWPPATRSPPLAA